MVPAPLAARPKPATEVAALVAGWLLEGSEAAVVGRPLAWQAPRLRSIPKWVQGVVMQCFWVQECRCSMGLRV